MNALDQLLSERDRARAVAERLAEERDAWILRAENAERELAISRAETEHQRERAESLWERVRQAEPAREAREQVIEELRRQVAWLERFGA